MAFRVIWEQVLLSTSTSIFDVSWWFFIKTKSYLWHKAEETKYFKLYYRTFKEKFILICAFYLYEQFSYVPCKIKTIISRFDFQYYGVPKDVHRLTIFLALQLKFDAMSKWSAAAHQIKTILWSLVFLTKEFIENCQLQ